MKRNDDELAEDRISYAEQSQTLFQILIENVQDIITIIDEEGIIRYVSPSVERVLGYYPAELIEMNIFDLLHPDDSSRLFESYQIMDKSYAADGIHRQARLIETRVRHKDGAWRFIESMAITLHIPLVKGFVINARDITERKQAEKEKGKLEAQKRQLHKAKSLTSMASAIAHHFNNKLQVVIGNLELALEALPRGEDPLIRLTSAMRATRMAAEMSGLMLTYLGQTPGIFEPLDLSEACRRCLAIIQVAIQKNVVLESDLPLPGPTVHANENQIQQVLTNLVNNAEESLGDGGGSINLSVKTVSSAEIPAMHRFPIDWQRQALAYAYLEVTDTGCGFEEKDIENIFDPFFSTKFIGRGMGLAVVLGIVQAHHGAVTVESEPGRGSAFRVFLPVSSEDLLRRPNNVVSR